MIKIGKDGIRVQAATSKLAKETIINALKDSCELLASLLFLPELGELLVLMDGKDDCAHQRFAKTDMITFSSVMKPNSLISTLSFTQKPLSLANLLAAKSHMLKIPRTCK